MHLEVARGLLLRAVQSFSARHVWHKIQPMLDMWASGDIRFMHSEAKLSTVGLSAGAKVVVFNHVFLKTYLTRNLIGHWVLFRHS